MAEPKATQEQQPPASAGQAAGGEAEGGAVSPTPAAAPAGTGQAAAEGGSGSGIPPTVDPSELAGGAAYYDGPLLVGEQVLYRMGGGPDAGFYRPAIVVRCIGEATADLVVFTGGDPGASELPQREPVQLVRTVTAGEEPGQFVRQAYRLQVG